MKPDKELLEDVIDELKWDPILHATEIGVTVKNGIITLSGQVNSYSKKLAAENAVKRVKDVRGLAEEINVKLSIAGQRTDAEIAQAAVSALKWNDSVPDDKIKVKVENGWVTLEGESEWQFEKDAAGSVVECLTGVKGMTNLVSIKPRINIPVIRESIKRALERSADVEAARITIETQGNKIILKGKARSWSERNQVERTAWSAAGVMAVEDELVIAP